MTEDIMALADEYGHACGMLEGECMRWDSSMRYITGLKAERDEARAALQAAVEKAINRGAPCERHCEANAFRIEIRGMKAQVERLEAQLAAARQQALEEAAKICEALQDATDRHKWPVPYDCAAAIRAAGGEE